MRKKWKTERSVKVGDPLLEFHGPRDSDQWRWWWLSLGLQINRHVAEYHDAETVSQHLDRVWNDPEKYPLPFVTS